MSRIFLIGARGSGKTTVGKRLAEALNFDFCDLDDSLCQRESCTIAEIVENSGWAHFRKLESEILAEAAQKSNTVLATGGGVILAPANRKFLRDAGTVIWLQTSPEQLAARLSDSLNAAQRPSLTGADPIDEIRAVLAEREPLYQEACHHIVNGDEQPHSVCAAILARLE